MAMPLRDLKDMKVDKLTVVGLISVTKHGALWRCRCDCGNEVQKFGTQLTRKVKHTGCRECEKLSRSQSSSLRTHGETSMGKTRLFNIWKDMRRRCRDPRVSHFKYYGGKGVRVCDEWNESFPAFKTWAEANGYKNHLSIDRLNPNGNYEPGNCDWVTRSENSRRAHLKVVGG